MLNEKRQKLLQYLYPNENIRKFLCNDLYMEFSAFIPSHVCISTKNYTLPTRKENLEKVTNLIKDFISNNPDYKQAILQIYKDRELDDIINELLIGYVFFVSNAVSRYNGVDIFKDKRSICYSPISAIDIL